MEIFNRYTMVYAAVYGQGFIASGTPHTHLTTHAVNPMFYGPILYQKSNSLEI